MNRFFPVLFVFACLVLPYSGKTQSKFPDDEQNLARKAVVTANLDADSATLARLTDGDPYTFWTSAVPAELEMDLGSIQAIGRIDLHIPPQYANPRRQTVVVQVSEDGGSYADVAPEAVLNFYAVNKNLVSLGTAGKSGRFIKIVIKDNSNDGGKALLSEVRVFAAP